jgi:putative hydrolase of the HAD superfamily
VLELIAFDADDTLWHNETLYQASQARYRELLAPFCSAADVDEALLATEKRNLSTLGYGIKAFTLSMIETAIELSGGRISGADVGSILDLAKEMIATPVQLLDHVAEVVPKLAQSHRLMILTKGDLLDQERKIAQSGLQPYVHHIEIVSEKDERAYRAILDSYGVAAEDFLMVGNSLRSDILPVAAVGGYAVHIPYHVTWVHETVDLPPRMADHYFEVAHMGELPALVAQIERDGLDSSASL